MAKLRVTLLLAAPFVVLAGCWWCMRFQRSRYHLVWDVYAVLVYYVEDRGVFPPSADSLIREGYLSSNAEGMYTVPARPRSKRAPYTYGTPFRLDNGVRVLWGADLSGLKVDEDGRVVDRDGNFVKLLTCFSFGLDEQYSAAIISAYRDVHREVAP